MLHLWGRTTSSNVMKVMWLLDELDLAFERTDAGLSFGVVGTEAYRTMNPFGLVPVLQDGAVTLFESNTILRYLCTAHAPDSPLYPRGAAQRAAVEAWMDAQLATLPPLGQVFLQLVRLPEAARDDAVLRPAIAASTAVFTVLNSRLETVAYLAGDGLTLADIAFGPFLHRWFALPLTRPDLPYLHAYYRRLLARPAYQARCAGKLS